MSNALAALSRPPALHVMHGCIKLPDRVAAMASRQAGRRLSAAFRVCCTSRFVCIACASFAQPLVWQGWGRRGHRSSAQQLAHSPPAYVPVAATAFMQRRKRVSSVCTAEAQACQQRLHCRAEVLPLLPWSCLMPQQAALVPLQYEAHPDCTSRSYLPPPSPPPVQLSTYGGCTVGPSRGSAPSAALAGLPWRCLVWHPASLCDAA